MTSYVCDTCGGKVSEWFARRRPKFSCPYDDCPGTLREVVE